MQGASAGPKWCLIFLCAGTPDRVCVWEIPALIEFVLQRQNCAHKVFDRMLHRPFLFPLILLELF